MKPTCAVQIGRQLLLQPHNSVIVVGHALGIQAKHTVALVALVRVRDEAAHLIGIPVCVLWREGWQQEPTFSRSAPSAKGAEAVRA